MKDKHITEELEKALLGMTSASPKGNKKAMVEILQRELGLDVVERIGFVNKRHTAVYFRKDEKGKAKYQFYLKQIEYNAKYPHPKFKKDFVEYE